MPTTLLEPPARSTHGLNPWPDALYSLRMSWGEDGRPLTQAKAAERLGISPKTWWRWESGGERPPHPIPLLFVILLENPDLVSQFPLASLDRLATTA